MAHSVVEREHKFDVEPGYVVPDLTKVLPHAGRLERVSERLVSEYYDTVDGALLRAGVTLRRRTGTTDTGWQLKIPSGSAREEIRLPLAGEEVPVELQRLLTGISGGQPLHSVARISTERSVQRLVDSAGRELAEIADDLVHSAVGGDTATLSSWREVEVELGSGDEQLLHDVGTALRRAGAHRSPNRSKLERALGGEPDGNERGKPRVPAVLTAYLAEQQRMLLAGDLALRRGHQDVVHQTRVATRRLRSALRTFAALTDPAQAATLDGELGWYATVLGQVRDRQVQLMRLTALVDQLPDADVLGPVRARIHTELSTELSEHWQILEQQLGSARYLALLGEVDRWITNPPWTDPPGKPALVVAKLLRRAERKVARRLARADAAGDLEGLHRVRKAAKRARYAAELAAPLIGNKRARRHAEHYRRLQDLLGEHQDSQLGAELVRRFGATAGTTPGENGYTFGILHEREQQTARVLRKKAIRVGRTAKF